jgi:predicted 2-oxoglutarate/Fe(II)-dependent dioxygenase YbiX
MTTVEITRPLFKPLRTDSCFCGSGVRFKSCCGSMAEPRNPPHGVHIIPNYLPPETCRLWVSHLESQHGRPLAVHSLDETGPSRLARERISGRITDKVEQGNLENAITGVVAQAFQTTVAAAMSRSVQWFEKPQVLRYEPGGLYGPHADSDHFIAAENHWRKVIDRDVSLLLYLNQEFEGGGLSFRQFNYTYRPRAGDLLCFPSSGQYAHEALPVKSGIRYVIVSWAAFRDEPRVLELRPSESIDLEP